jgi:hypothetical protein
MKELDEDNLENFIRQNREKFDVYRPPENHLNKFLVRLQLKVRQVISIVPYLVRVAIVTVVIFTASIIVWNNHIRKDRHEVTLKQKIVNVFTTNKK